MLKNAICLIAMATSISASATTMWTPSDNQKSAPQQPAPQSQDGWGKIFGDLLGGVLQSPEVTGAVCDSLPKEYKKLCSASVGDPKAREAAANACAEEISPHACYNVVASGNFMLEAVDLCKGMDEKTICFREIDGNSYDKNALALCTEMSWDEEKFSCVRAIKNKTYEPFMADSCRQQSFADDQIACLRAVGI